MTTAFPEDFDSWLANLHLNDAVMSLIYQIYQLDMIGKVNSQTLLVSLKARLKHDYEPLPPDVVDAFSQFMASGALEVYCDKKNRQ